MTQSDFERQVAAATGESRRTIRTRGFMLIEPPYLAPLVIDWDELHCVELPRRAHRPERRAKLSS